MNAHELEKFGKRLRNRWPWIGVRLRRRAAEALAADGGAGVVPLLVEARGDSDALVGATALRCLGSLKQQASIDGLCGLWAGSLDSGLGDLLRERQYVAARPPKVRVLSALKAGKLDVAGENAAAVKECVEARRHGDAVVADHAVKALGELSKAEAIDQLGALWVEGRDSGLGGLVRDRGYVARTPMRVRVLSALKAGKLDAVGEAADAVAECAAAVGDKDPEVAASAGAYLRAMGKPEAIDKLCAIWVESREAGVGAIIAEKQYVAREPMKVRALSALKAGCGGVCVESTDAVAELSLALKDSEEGIQRAAADVVRTATDRRPVDLICRRAMEEPKGALAKLCADHGKRPSRLDEECVFLVVTNQLDEYAKKGDIEFQELFAGYVGATATVQAHAMDAYRSGDHRLAGFQDIARRPLERRSPKEIEMFIETELRRENWAELFKAFVKLPVKHGYPVLERLAASEWEPTDGGDRELFRRAMELARSQGRPGPDQAVGSSVFEKWLREGSSMTGMNEADLVKRLAAADPPEGVKLVAALARMGRGDAARKAVGESEHWMIRMAGLATGLVKEVAQDEPNHWVRELGGSASMLESWPERTTPLDLERFRSQPLEMLLGPAGRIRRVLGLLMEHHCNAMIVKRVEHRAPGDAIVVKPFETGSPQ